jgi:hypothetical protein
MEATRSSETSAYNKPTRRHIQESGILQNAELFAMKGRFTDNAV